MESDTGISNIITKLPNKSSRKFLAHLYFFGLRKKRILIFMKLISCVCVTCERKRKRERERVLQNCNLVILELLPLLFSGSKNDWECGKWNAKKGCFLHTESSRLKTKKYLSNIINMCNILKNIQFLLKLKKNQ